MAFWDVTFSAPASLVHARLPNIDARETERNNVSMTTWGSFIHRPSEAAVVPASNVPETRPPLASDQQLCDYIAAYFGSYRLVIDTFFPKLGPFLPTYANYPYHTRVLRMGDAGFIIGHAPSGEARVSFMRPDEFDPPMVHLNIFDIIKRWNAAFVTFDFSEGQSYAVERAQESGARHALTDALAAFWAALPASAFEELCRRLVELEGFSTIAIEPSFRPGVQRDLTAEFVFDEPAGFRRLERWDFEFKHFGHNRLSARDLRAIEERLSKRDDLDVLCLMTSGDITSIGNAIAVSHPKIRVWDRQVLEWLINNHLPAIAPFFPEYEAAAMHFAATRATATAHGGVGPSLSESFKERLQRCAPGRASFREFELLGTELLTELFAPNLGPPKDQRTTSDGTLRRDVFFRNNRTGPFWPRIASRFDADLVVVDFKNHEDEIGPSEIDDTARYLNKAIGKFALVVSRKGPAAAVEPVQVRLLRDGKIVLVINDQQMLEMATRKERGESPEDLLDDLLDELLMKY